MGRKQDPVAFAKLAVFTLTLDTKPRGAIHQKHEFVAVLIVPLAFRRRLTGRYDALDAQARALDKQIHDLIRQRPHRQAPSKITGLDHGQNLAQTPPGLAASAEMPEKAG